MELKINLHAHNGNSSHDSRTPPCAMEKVYSALGFDAVGFVGHDERADYSGDELIIFNGIEHTAVEYPEIHIVEYPDYDFSFLAHPMRMGGGDVKKLSENIFNQEGLDAVEKYNDGFAQYEGSLGMPELANDDAHNPIQIGTSYMMVDVESPTKRNIMREVKNGRAELVNKRRRILGSVLHSLNIAVSKLGSA